jgi:hypothetical protein
MTTRYEVSHRYTGVAPAGSTANAPQATFKTGVNSRMPLTMRCATPTLPDISSGSVQCAMLATGERAFTASVKDGGVKPLEIALPRRHYGGASPFAPSASIRSAADIAPRAHEYVAPADADAPAITMASHRSAAHSMSEAYATNPNAGLMSRVRQIEAVDDAARAAQVKGNARADEKTNLRTAAIVHKRETDPRLAPAKELYSTGPRTRPNAVRQNASDSVRFTYMQQPSSYEVEYKAPYDTHEGAHLVHDSVRLPRPLRYERAIVEVAGGSDLMPGTSKVMPHIVSHGYTGHVPAHPRNVARINGPGHEVLREHSRCALSSVTRSPSAAAQFRRLMGGTLKG